MSIWKEPAPNEEAEKAVHEPVPQNPIPARVESVPKARHESVLGRGVTIDGKIEGDGDLRIGGNIKGDIQIKGDLNIEKGARVAAKVHAENVNIGGDLEGNVVASSQVRLLDSAQLVGDLKAKTLTVAAGSRMRGHVEFGWNESESLKVASIRSTEKAKAGSAL